MNLVGRRPALDRLRALAGERRSALLIGAEGMGRSALLRELDTALVSSKHPTWLVVGADSESEIPLVPFAGLIGEYAGQVVESPITAYTAVPPALARAGLTVLIDDLHLLDRASQVLVAQLARAGVSTVATAPSTDHLPSSIRDDLATTWAVEELGPLSPDAVLEIASSVVGDELSAPSASMLLRHAAGNPLLVHEILAGAEPGLAPSTAGVELGPLRVTTRMRQIVLRRAQGLTTEARNAMEVLALAGRLPHDSIGAEEVGQLSRSGMLTDLRPPADLELSDPLTYAVIIDHLDLSTQRQRCAEAADLLGDPAWWGLRTLMRARAGQPVTDADLVSAAERALSANRAPQALDLLSRCISATHLISLLRGAAHSALDQLAEATPLLDHAAEASDPQLRVRAGQELGLLHGVRRADPPGAVARVTEVLSTLTEPAQRRTLQVDLVKWRLMAGLVPEPVAGEADPTDAVATVNDALIGAMIDSLDGDPAQAQRRVDQGLAALSTTDAAVPFAGDLLRLSSYLALAFDGRADEAEAFALELRNRAAYDADPALGMWEFATAELALHTGRYQLAEVLAARAVRHLAWHDFTGLRPAAGALLAAVSARQGRSSFARSLTDALTDAQLADIKVALHVSRVRAEDHLQAEKPVQAAEVLAAAGLGAIAQSHRHLGLMCLDEAIMVAPLAPAAPEWVAVLEENAHRTPLLSALAVRAAALTRGDSKALAASAEALQAAGLVGRAAQATGAAAALHETADALDSSRRLRRNQVLLLSTTRASPWPTIERPHLLSPRELEIARMAARRQRSKEIAEVCGLSLRTVDNHLARIYRKLGVTGRDELPAALVALDGDESRPGG